MRFLTILLNALFPPVCVSCKREGDFLCLDCLKSLDKKKIKSRYSKYEDSDLHYLDGVIYALDYAKNPQIKAAVKQFKYRFTQELADHFADLIVEKIGQLNMVKGRQIILIPVPLHKKRLSPGTVFQSVKGPLHKIYPDEQDTEADDDFADVLDRLLLAEYLQPKADSYCRQGIRRNLQFET